MGKHAGFELDTRAIWGRVLKSSKLRTYAALAEALNMSPQALNTTNLRRSISMSLLFKIRQLTGMSMDHIMFGEGAEDLGLEENKLDYDEYIFIKRTNGGQLKFLRELLLSAGKKDASSFLALVEDDRLYIADVNDTNIRDGLFLLGSVEKGMAVRRCKLLATGSVTVEDDTYNVEDLVIIPVMGRVVWTGSKPTMECL